MSQITLEQYFAAYPNHPAITDEILEAARQLLNKVNLQIARAEHEGCVFETNQHTESPHFGTLVSGMGNGAWRPPECTEGAAHSKHKEGRAVDLCDHQGRVDAWSDAHEPELKENGIGREAPDSTPNWCHWQDGPSALGHWTFNPGTPAIPVQRAPQP